MNAAIKKDIEFVKNKMRNFACSLKDVAKKEDIIMVEEMSENNWEDINVYIVNIFLEELSTTAIISLFYYYGLNSMLDKVFVLIHPGFLSQDKTSDSGKDTEERRKKKEEGEKYIDELIKKIKKDPINPANPKSIQNVKILFMGLNEVSVLTVRDYGTSVMKDSEVKKENKIIKYIFDFLNKDFCRKIQNNRKMIIFFK